LIGEAPGVSEDVLGTAFIGEAGKMLDFVLTQAGIDIDCCFFTNCVLCRPCDDKMGENREPLKDEVLACMENTKMIINSVNKLGTVLLGKDANRWFKSRVNDAPFVHIIHPSALLKQGGPESSMYKYTINELIRFKERIGL
jgi:uracil-DNA glycosylase family 4